MATKLERLEDEVLLLDPRSRAHLAERLLRSLESLSDAEIETLWLDEAERRAAELTGEPGLGIPAEDVIREFKSRLS